MGAVLAMRLAKTRPRPLRAAILTGCFPIDFAIAASRRHADWSLEVLEHGGHHAHVTEPHLWAATVTSWLDEHADGAA
jgi:hypothetical protein